MTPLVTAIMPTRNRANLVPLAIECFLRQDYPNRELLIIDASDRENRYEGPGIRHERLAGKDYTIGAMRNIACSRAAGDIIIHADDDDWYSPTRMSDQVARLLSSGASISGYRSIVFANDDLRRAWQYLGAKDYAVGTSLCYRRDYWLSHRFLDVMAGEDNHMVAKASSIATVGGESMIVARVHSGNTSESYQRLYERKWTGGQFEQWKEIDYAGLSLIGYPVNPMALTEVA